MRGTLLPEVKMPKPSQTSLVIFIKQRAKLKDELKTAKPARAAEINRLIATLNKEISKLDDKQK